MLRRGNLNDHRRRIRNVINAERRNGINGTERRLFVGDGRITNKDIRQDDGFGKKYFDRFAHIMKVSFYAHYYN